MAALQVLKWVQDDNVLQKKPLLVKNYVINFLDSFLQKTIFLCYEEEQNSDFDIFRNKVFM